MDELTASLSKIERLEKLDLGRNSLQSRSVELSNVLQTIGELQQLTWLSLRCTGAVSGLTTALQSLQTAQKVWHLDISSETGPSFGALPRDECASIADTLCSFKSIRSLHINNPNLLTDTAAVSGYCPNLLSLEVLDLRGTCSFTRAVEVFIHIKSMCRLQSLQLRGNSFVPDALISLLGSITGLTCLTYLGLANCNIKDEGLLCVIPSIKQMRPLRELDVRENGFSDVSWGALIPALHRGSDVVCLRADGSCAAYADSSCEPMQHVDIDTVCHLKKQRFFPLSDE